LSEEDEDQYSSLPFGQPLGGWKATSPDICSSYYPSDRESDDESPRKAFRIFGMLN
jgi:hypothetical protein